MPSEPKKSDVDSKDMYKEASHQVNPSDHDTQERQYLTGLRLAIVLGSLTLVSSSGPQVNSTLEVFVSRQPYQAILQITTEFNALADVGWYISAYNLAACASQRQPTQVEGRGLTRHH
ncbi:uncharacterized protein EKO05_0011084 [Ascochyta rabiei]|uniref:uncharacterized protein n=1 Tax=Didymella rabiei TaxID=5454 RepID=UPI0021FDE459|nr:uncharacterized protein EKO05_0011084 [Ascochyta rabiei]UPX20870.1 hypothetical protein EKO05_0011084 [Ascochyta rabiei]